MAHKEFLHVLRDPRSLGMALVLPVLMLMLFGYALTLDVDRVPTVILDRDRTDNSRELIDLFRGSRYFEIVGVVSSYAEIEEGIEDSRYLIGVVIPNHYSEY